MNDPSRFLRELPHKYLAYSTDGVPSFFSDHNDSDQDYLSDSFSETSDEQVYDYTETSEGLTALACKKGALVHHPTYGKGVIQGLETTFSKTKVIVNFLEYGERKILPTHLSLIRSLD